MGSKQEMEDCVGITSPITNETAVALYHQQLPRQLADFVKLPLEKAGGMLAMFDVYCLFNRAQGTKLISASGHAVSLKNSLYEHLLVKQS